MAQRLCFVLGRVRTDTDAATAPVAVWYKDGPDLRFRRVHSEADLGVAGPQNGKVDSETGAVAILGVNPSTLRSKMRKLGIR